MLTKSYEEAHRTDPKDGIKILYMVIFPEYLA